MLSLTLSTLGNLWEDLIDFGFIIFNSSLGSVRIVVTIPTRLKQGNQKVSMPGRIVKAAEVVSSSLEEMCLIKPYLDSGLITLS